MATYAGQIDVEIEADSEAEAEELLSEVRRTVARRPEIEHAAAGSVECIYDCPDEADDIYDDLSDYEDDPRGDEPPF